MGLMDSIRGFFNREESNKQEVKKTNEIRVSESLERNNDFKFRDRIGKTLSYRDLYEKTDSLEKNIELYEAELCSIQIDNDDDLLLINTTYKGNSDLKDVVDKKVLERRKLAEIKCNYRGGFINWYCADRGLKLAKRYKDNKGVAVFTEVLEHFSSTGETVLWSESYAETVARKLLINIVDYSITTDQYGEGIVYPNEWRKYAIRVDSEIKAMDQMGLDKNGEEFRNRIEEVLKEIKTEVDKNDERSRDAYLTSNNSLDNWGTIERNPQENKSNSKVHENREMSR